MHIFLINFWYSFKYPTQQILKHCSALPITYITYITLINVNLIACIIYGLHNWFIWKTGILIPFDNEFIINREEQNFTVTRTNAGQLIFYPFDTYFPFIWSSDKHSISSKASCNISEFHCIGFCELAFFTQFFFQIFSYLLHTLHLYPLLKQRKTIFEVHASFNLYSKSIWKSNSNSNSNIYSPAQWKFN